MFYFLNKKIKTLFKKSVIKKTLFSVKSPLGLLTEKVLAKNAF